MDGLSLNGRRNTIEQNWLRATAWNIFVLLYIQIHKLTVRNLTATTIKDCGRIPRKCLAGSDPRQYKAGEAVLPNHIHVGTNEQTSSARLSIKTPERAACTGGPCLVWLNRLCLLSARAPPWHNGCQAAQCGLVVVFGSEWTGFGNSGHAVIKANRWCSCISPAPLPCHPFQFLIKNERVAHFYLMLFETSWDWFSPIIIFHALFLHSSHACVNRVFSHVI